MSPFVQVLVATATPKRWTVRTEEVRVRKRRAGRGMAGEEEEEEEARVEETRNGTKIWTEKTKMAFG